MLQTRQQMIVIYVWSNEQLLDDRWWALLKIKEKTIFYSLPIYRILLLTSVTFLKSHIWYFWQFCSNTGMLNLFILKNKYLLILMHNEICILFIIYELLPRKHKLESINCLILYIFVTLLLGTRIWKLYLHVNSLSILRHKLSFIHPCSSFLFAWMNKKEL